jgi:hypothetical protein
VRYPRHLLGAAIAGDHEDFRRRADLNSDRQSGHGLRREAGTVDEIFPPDLRQADVEHFPLAKVFRNHGPHSGCFEKPVIHGLIESKAPQGRYGENEILPEHDGCIKKRQIVRLNYFHGSSRYAASAVLNLDAF